jgi:hypothetical protein
MKYSEFSRTELLKPIKKKLSHLLDKQIIANDMPRWLSEEIDTPVSVTEYNDPHEFLEALKVVDSIREWTRISGDITFAVIDAEFSVDKDQIVVRGQGKGEYRTLSVLYYHKLNTIDPDLVLSYLE